VSKTLWKVYHLNRWFGAVEGATADKALARCIKLNPAYPPGQFTVGTKTTATETRAKLPHLIREPKA